MSELLCFSFLHPAAPSLSPSLQHHPLASSGAPLGRWRTGPLPPLHRFATRCTELQRGAACGGVRDQCPPHLTAHGPSPPASSPLSGGVLRRKTARVEARRRWPARGRVWSGRPSPPHPPLPSSPSLAVRSSRPSPPLHSSPCPAARPSTPGPPLPSSPSWSADPPSASPTKARAA